MGANDQKNEEFQKFLDTNQYARKGILLYERIFGATYISTGGEATTKQFCSELTHTGLQVISLDIFTRVGTYVQRGSMFCFVVVVVVLGADTLLKILHYCPISPCFQHIIAPLHTALPGSLAHACPQPCARLPGSLARACPEAFRALARQPCARLPGSCCPDKSEQVQQNITPDTSTGFDMRALSRSTFTALYYSGRSPNCMRALLS
jgi:hypothetical protein